VPVSIDPAEPLSSLIARCADRGRRDLLDSLVARLQPRVAAVVARALRKYGVHDAEMVKDLCQDTFLKVLGSNFKLAERTRGRSDGEVLALVSVTAANLAVDALRSNKENVPLDKTPEVAKSDDMERRVLLRQVEDLLEEVLVPPNRERDRKIFWLYHRARMTAREIALLPEIGLGVKGVESALYRVTSDLRAALASRAKGISAKGSFQ
jgi:RNA polymerase sigma factor (sigma-70 family)